MPTESKARHTVIGPSTDRCFGRGADGSDGALGPVGPAGPGGSGAGARAAPQSGPSGHPVAGMSDRVWPDAGGSGVGGPAGSPPCGALVVGGDTGPGPPAVLRWSNHACSGCAAGSAEGVASSRQRISATRPITADKANTPLAQETAI